MADNKKALGAKDEPGPKSEDTEVVAPSTATEQAGADQFLEQSRGRSFGDNTSSSGGANTAGLHGRDGGVSEGTSNNPAPSAEAITGEAPADSDNEEGASEDSGVKKL